MEAAACADKSSIFLLVSRHGVELNSRKRNPVHETGIVHSFFLW
jgi:hypothetical protein